MSKVTRFEDLKCWQAARELVRQVYLTCDEGKLSKDFETRGQLKRAALSSMNNIAEGFARNSSREFIRFLDFAQSSSVEIQSMLYALEDVNYVPAASLKSIRLQADETRNLTMGLIHYLRKNRPINNPIKQ